MYLRDFPLAVGEIGFVLLVQMEYYFTQTALPFYRWLPLRPRGEFLSHEVMVTFCIITIAAFESFISLKYPGHSMEFGTIKVVDSQMHPIR